MCYTLFSLTAITPSASILNKMLEKEEATA
jgi:hypothetical protein